MRDHKDELYSNKGNEIIQSYAWDLKEKQLKIMELLCSCYMTNYYDTGKNTITVGVADFMKELGFSTTGLSSREYKRFEEAIQKLSDTSIIGIGYNGKRRIIRLINTAEFPTEAGETAIVCHMSEDFKECMKLQDRGNTKIEFKTICSMDSRYSIKLYNLLRSWQGKDEVFFDLDYLKELLNITAKSYDNFGKFRQAVLDVAINEINEKTNLQVTYEGLTAARSRSRKITRVVFNIKNTGLPNERLNELPATGSDTEAVEEYDPQVEFDLAIAESEANETEDIAFFRTALTDEHGLTSAQIDYLQTLAKQSDWAKSLPFYMNNVERDLKIWDYIRLQDKYTRANLKNKNSYFKFMEGAVQNNWASIADYEE